MVRAGVSSPVTDSAHATQCRRQELQDRQTITPIATSELYESRIFDARASIILVGLRGVGKRSLGFIAAAQLGRRFVSEGLWFEDITGLTKAQYFTRHGANEFHNRRLAVFRQMLESNSNDCVIECGVASLAPTARQLLRRFAKTHPVIHITRNPNHICQVTGIEDSDASISRMSKADLEHRACSNLEFYNLYDPTCRDGVAEVDFSPSSSFILRDVKLDFQTFIRLTTGRLALDHRHPASISSVRLDDRIYTYALTLRLSALLSGAVDVNKVESGEDAVELEVDVFPTNIYTTISKIFSQIRRERMIPIIFKVDAKCIQPAGDASILYFQLLHHALRLGVEYIVVDLESADHQIQRLIAAKGYSRVIGHRHFEVTSPGGWLDDSRADAYRKALSMGFDIVRFEQPATCRQDNMDARVFHEYIAHLKTDARLIAYNTGHLGKTSLIFNRILTPVGPLEPEPQRCKRHANAPISPLTVQEATSALFACHEFDALRFYILGDSRDLSAAPAAYKASFHMLGMKHEFHFCDAKNWEEMAPIMSMNDFGGLLVRFNHKVPAVSVVNSLSKQAKAIGAVNIILPMRQSVDGATPPFEQQSDQRNRAGMVSALHGENTDWIGIMRCFRRKLSPRNTVNNASGSGVVLGAGGAARAAVYAMIHLGCRNIFIYNRTEENAIAVANHFNAWAAQEWPGRLKPVRVLRRDKPQWPQDVDFPTLIMSCIPATAMESINIPYEWLASPSGGVVGKVC